LIKTGRGFKTLDEEDQSQLPGTGVAHFISSKLRMHWKRLYLDGEDPSALLIPVMELTQAKSWQGEVYCALCDFGLPSDGKQSQKGDPRNYTNMQLSTMNVINEGAINDATIH
jgi:hypothetical protein